jgi:hypothetical protein
MDCGFVRNPTRTADTHQLVHEAEPEKLDRMLKDFYGWTEAKKAKPKAAPTGA